MTNHPNRAKRLDRETTTRLVAAAPDMLAALKALSRAVDNAGYWKGDMAKYSNEARTIIAKATGKDQ